MNQPIEAAHQQLNKILATHTQGIALQERAVAGFPPDIISQAQRIVEKHHDIFPSGYQALDAKILFVDDESHWLNTSSDEAERNGHTVRQASSSNRATQILNDPNMPVDAIVCDGLGGDWEDVYSASAGTRFLLFSADNNQLRKAKHNHIEAIDKLDFGEFLKYLKQLPK